jgi:hypothetical protein
MIRLPWMALACLLLLAPTGTAATAQQVKPSCSDRSRACMIATATAYIDALTRHDASKAWI